MTQIPERYRLRCINLYLSGICVIGVICGSILLPRPHRGRTAAEVERRLDQLLALAAVAEDVQYPCPAQVVVLRLRVRLALERLVELEVVDHHPRAGQAA